MKSWVGIEGGKRKCIECNLCGAECESVVHVLWECSAYGSCRLMLLEKKNCSY